MHNLKLSKIACFFNILLIFSIIFDPTNLFKVKDISFVLFVLLNIGNASFKHVLIPLTFLATYFSSTIVGVLLSIPTDQATSLNILKSYLFLIYLFWMHREDLKEIKYFYIATKIMALITIFLFFTMSYFNKYEVLFYTFIHYTLKDTIMIARRVFYGIPTMMIFFRTSPLMAISLAMSLSLFYTRHKSRYFFDSIIFMVALIASGTRANMLTGMLLFFIVSLFYIYYYKKQVFIFATCSLLFIYAAFFVIFLLLTVKEESTAVKGGHLISYMNLFDKNPLLYLLIGGGPGSLFYTSGFDSIVPMTELTYLDLIKNYGFIQAIILIGIFCLPFIGIINSGFLSNLEKFSLSFGWLGYLFIAGTNPLLISSTGFIAFAIAVYITKHPYYIELFDKQKMRKSYIKRLLKYAS